MDQQLDDYDSEVVRWLEDTGRRRALRLQESPEELLKYIEELTGRTLASREDIASYFRELKSQEIELERARTKYRIAREVVFLGSLLVAAGQYYFWDVQLQIAALQKVHYFVPEPRSAARQSF